MNMWVEYIKEREGVEVIEHPFGFIAYKISGEECYINDMYVRPDCREKGNGMALLAGVREIAEKFKCKYISGRVDLTSKDACGITKLGLAWGAKLVSAHNNQVILIKEL